MSHDNFASGAKMIKFVLLTTQRSGSTYVRLWLNSHPDIRCHSEIFFRGYPATDGFRAYCEANRIRQLLYRTLGKHKFTKSPHNIAIKWLIWQFLHNLYHNPTFSAPWTDMTTEAWTEYQPRAGSEPEMVVGI